MPTRSRLLASSVVALTLVLTPPLALAQGPPPPSTASRSLLTTLDIPNAADRLGQVFLTDLNENVPPQLTIAFNFFEHRLRQPSLIYTRDDRFTRVFCPAPAQWTALQGINRHGDSVGWCYHEDAQEASVVTAFYRSAAGTITLIPIPGAVLAEAQDVNNHKHVTGSWIDHAGDCHGFLWDAVTRQLTTFDAPFKGARCTVPMVMNNADVIGGLYFQPVGAAHGFLYDSRRGVWTAVEPDGADVSAVTGLNDFGTAIVYSQTLAAGTTISTYQAATGTFAVLPWPLPPFGNNDERIFHSINNQGQLLGTHTMTVDLEPSDPEAGEVGFQRGVVATPLPQAPATLVAGRTAPQRVLTHNMIPPEVLQRPLDVQGCPGDGGGRPGKWAMVWAGCR